DSPTENKSASTVVKQSLSRRMSMESAGLESFLVKDGKDSGDGRCPFPKLGFRNFLWVRARFAENDKRCNLTLQLSHYNFQFRDACLSARTIWMRQHHQGEMTT